MSKERFEHKFEIAKQDDDNHLVFGWASIVEKGGNPVEDSQGSVILPEDLEESAYGFVLMSRQAGDMHDIIGVGSLVESVVFTIEKQEMMGIQLGFVGWWVGFHVEDEGVWKRIKKGELTMFSIGGIGVRTPLE